MNELKPCPFCGGEAEILTAESMHGGYLFGIMCNDCRSRGDVFDTEAEAIAAWNTRAERTCRMHRNEFGVWCCGSCGEELDSWNDGWAPDYCPNCGAKEVE